jgi:hypothetical protein
LYKNFISEAEGRRGRRNSTTTAVFVPRLNLSASSSGIPDNNKPIAEKERRQKGSFGTFETGQSKIQLRCCCAEERARCCSFEETGVVIPLVFVFVSFTLRYVVVELERGSS